MKIDELIEKWVNAPCGCGLEESDCKCADLQILVQCLKVALVRVRSSANQHWMMGDVKSLYHDALAEIERLAGGE